VLISCIAEMEERGDCNEYVIDVTKVAFNLYTFVMKPANIWWRHCAVTSLSKRCKHWLQTNENWFSVSDKIKMINLMKMTDYETQLLTTYKIQMSVVLSTSSLWWLNKLNLLIWRILMMCVNKKEIITKVPFECSKKTCTGWQNLRNWETSNFKQSLHH